MHTFRWLDNGMEERSRIRNNFGCFGSQLFWDFQSKCEEKKNSGKKKE